MASLGSDVRALVTVVEARLNGHPASADEWRTIHRQLRAAADKARKITKLAERMEDSSRPTERTVSDCLEAYDAFENARRTLAVASDVHHDAMGDH